MTLQEVLAFARQMSNREDVAFATSITVTIEVDISMSNDPERGVTVFLSLPEKNGVSFLANVDAYTQDGEEITKLSAEEVCDMLNIPEDADWQMSNHGTFIG